MMGSDPVERPPRVAVCGAGVCGRELAAVAEAVGRELARAGAVLLCGGLGGVMEAAARGAAEEGGIVVGVLPGRDARNANRHVGIPLPTGMGEGRNVLVVRFAEALIAIGGEWGTLSEVALARKIDVPVVLLRPGLTAGLDLPETTTAAEAVAWALDAARPTP
ncbi:MAG TPA: TIGR00725 family protein [Longimicrobiales bacterium]|nr:TIGR00725 family protein [Longimicrobiales bacterium]